MVCTKCGLDKDLQHFYVNHRHPSGYVTRCKTCYHEARKDYEKSPAFRQSTRKHRLKKKYGISPERFHEMVEEQGGLCGNTGCPNPGNFIDHNHSTGQVRSLLCHNCNSSLGLLKESPARIAGLLEYAKRWQA